MTDGRSMLKGRVNRLHHKLSALKFHSAILKNEEKRIERKEYQIR
jgi:hypothetical protein